MRPERARAVRIVLLAVVVAVGCTFAGLWQWGRAEHRERAVEVLRSNWAAEPVALEEVLASPAAPLAEDAAWRAVRLRGRYLEDATVLLRNRPVGGTPAFHLLEPFAIEAPGSPFDGAVLVVDRGWVPIGEDASVPAEVPGPPSGEVGLVVRLRPAEPVSGRQAPAGQTHSVAPRSVTTAPLLVEGAYGSLVSEDPAPAVLPAALERPSADYGPHRSYAFQWWVFALGALGGFGWLALREWRGTEGLSPSPAAPRPAPRRRSAEDEEDALLDASEAQARETSSR